MYLRIFLTLLSLLVVIWAVTHGDVYVLIWLAVPIGIWLDHFRVTPAVSYTGLAFLFVSIGLFVWVSRDLYLPGLRQFMTKQWLTTIVILFLPVFFGLYAAYVWWEKRRLARK
ncbi:hypothetical protein Astex_0915 [Asticcacaulis excentricus CB 48]|uniref:Transmembrane protein n=1 Tax=Asticcacaulis excentricus (strain ATCC 15261 / DSM 4724 / KCTC 12464 / NCIMB 9791 / VKM B-1370 / CB 48) TaxID=573065 RepID=E8RLA6_ASTEC|nr:hypothetical protein Astex_0915 [Asticcacaulis excentricus CB 48]